MRKKSVCSVRIYDYVGKFAEDKDRAKEIRQEILWPQVKIGAVVEMDFAGVEDVTQSFVHALLSGPIRETQGEVLDLVCFKNCNETAKKMINMVVDYMQEN